jgi:hypothetical protein
MIDIVTKRDSAHIIGPKYSFYYGKLEDTEEFQFVVIKGGKEVYRKANSEFGQFDGKGPVEMLLTGIGLYFNK